MPTLTNRSAYAESLKQTARDQRMIFESISGDLTRLIQRYTDADGKIPPQKSQALRDEARALVTKYFVTTRRATPDEHRTESERLRGLIATAQGQMRGATERQKAELRTRVTMLAKRLDRLVNGGLIVESIDDKGAGMTPFARSLMNGIRGLVGEVVSSHAVQVRKAKAKVSKHD
jgi:uncharacterized membrane protein YccC